MSYEHAVRHLAEAAIRQYPTEAAPLLERMRTVEVAEFLERQDTALATEVVRRLRPDRAAEVLETLSESCASRVLSTLEPSHAATLVARMDEASRRARLNTLAPAVSNELTAMMSYAPGVVGAIMDPRVTSFRPEITAGDALAHIRSRKKRASHDVFTIDEEGRLSGSVSIQDLALANPNVRLAELIQPTPPRVHALAPHEDLVALAEARRLSSVPVVDIADRLLGVIPYSVLLTITQRDATADLQTMVGVSREERALSSVAFAVRKRLPWLQINLATAFLAASVVGLFEDTIARFSALAVLLPVVAGQSGNTGAQALAVTMRGLALREIRVRHWFRIARKEAVSGLINGLAVALVTSLAVFLWSQSAGIAGVIGVAMVCSMTVAGLAGASVPMALILLRQDPAAASSIVLTTVTDVMGFFTFLGFATLASAIL
jgi:magnesium transporter